MEVDAGPANDIVPTPQPIVDVESPIAVRAAQTMVSLLAKIERIYHKVSDMLNSLKRRATEEVGAIPDSESSAPRKQPPEAMNLNHAAGPRDSAGTAQNPIGACCAPLEAVSDCAG